MHLVVDSVTGVELSLPLAGPGARCYAFLIDWLIRTVLFTAWYGAGALIYNGRWSLTAPASPDPKWFIFIVVPPAAIYFLYHIILEIGMHGRTPGKRMAGIHIVMRDGGPPSVTALLVRNVFRLVDSLPLAYGVGLVAALATADHVRVGDMAAGTLLAYERVHLVLPVHSLWPRADTTLRGSSQARQLRVEAIPAAAELAGDLLSRWSALDRGARRELARKLLAWHGESVSAGTHTDAGLQARLKEICRGSRHE